jgi:hypothetical protein
VLPPTWWIFFTQSSGLDQTGGIFQSLALGWLSNPEDFLPPTKRIFFPKALRLALMEDFFTQNV